MAMIKSFDGSLSIVVLDKTDPVTITVDLKGSGIEPEALAERIASIVREKLDVAGGWGRSARAEAEKKLADAQAQIAKLEAALKPPAPPDAPAPAPASEGIHGGGLEPLTGARAPAPFDGDVPKGASGIPTKQRRGK